MSVKTVAEKFTASLTKGDFAGAEKFWSKDVVSIEAMDGPMKEVRGLEAVKGKSVWWNENHISHSFKTEGPYINGDQFSVVFDIDVTQKGTGQRIHMKEVALYTVKDDKVVEERFFGPPM
jgi:ketosteroid isomerase-like protein